MDFFKRIDYRRLLQSFARHFWGILLTLVIAVAILVQLGRQAFPLLDDYRHAIGDYLGGRLGVNITIGSVSAQWSGLTPRLSLYDVKVESVTGEAIFSVANASAELSLLDSMSKGRMSWRQINFVQFHTEIVQQESGRWDVKGYYPSPKKVVTKGEQQFKIDDPFDIFLFGRRVEIAQANLTLRFLSGRSTQISVPKISLENDRLFHRLKVDVGFDQNQQALSLVVEGHGDPRNDIRFTSKGYLKLEKFPTEKVLAALVNSWHEGVDQPQSWQQGKTLDMQIWFDGNFTQGLNLQGELFADGLPVSLDDKVELPESIRARFSGLIKQHQWQLQLTDLDIPWMQQQAPLEKIAFYGEGLTVGLRLPELDITRWLQLVDDAGIYEAYPRLAKVVKTLSPQGKLRNLEVRSASKDDGYFLARADVVAGSSQAYMGAPALSNINGRVEASLIHGAIDLDTRDGLSLFLPKLYSQPLHFSMARGVIDWQIDFAKRYAYVNSSRLTVANDDEYANGYLNLEIPFNRRVGEAQMNLAIGIRETQVKYYKKYVPHTVNKNLRQWLDSALGEDGVVHDAQFLYSGSVDKKQSVRPTIALMGEVRDADIQFSPDWLPANQVHGFVSYENLALKASIDHGFMGAANIDKVDIALDAHTQQPRLFVQGTGSGDVSQAKAILLNSPAREALASTIIPWQMRGAFVADFDLDVPLFDLPGTRYNIEALLDNTEVNMTDIGLTLTKLEGALRFQTGNQLSANAINAQLWGEKIDARIATFTEDNNQHVDILFGGNVPLPKAAYWLQQPSLLFATGTSHVDGRLRIPIAGAQVAKGVTIDLSSQLKGAVIDLPKPFNKAARTQQLLTANLQFASTRRDYVVALGDDLHVRIADIDNQPIAIEAVVGQTLAFDDAQFRPGQLRFRGDIDSVDMEQWLQAIDQYQDYEQKVSAYVQQWQEPDAVASVSGDNMASAALAVSGDLQFAHANLGEFEVSDVTFAFDHAEPEAWQLNFGSKVLTGTATLFDDETVPMAVAFSHVHLPDDNTQAVDAATPSDVPNDDVASSIFADFDVRDLPPMTVQVDDFKYGIEDYGRWQFSIEPFDGGVTFTNIHAAIRGIHVGSETSPSNLRWTQSAPGKNQTHLIATFSGKNLGDMLKAWGQEEMLTSEKALISIDTSWHGAPDELELLSLNGGVAFNLEKGSFIRGGELGENPLIRLLALFNFDTFARRLRLDFSDLAARGFAYDTVNGDMTFRDGKLYLTQPLRVRSSSSTMQMAGTVDLLHETIDTELVVTLPVAANLAVAAAFVGGLPAGVGVYVVSKLFKQQVNKVSSLNYSILGDWEKPKIRVEKVFNDSAAKKKGQQVEKEIQQEEAIDAAAPSSE